MAVQLPNGLSLTIEACRVDVSEDLTHALVQYYQWYLEGRLSLSRAQAVKLYEKRLAHTIGQYRGTPDGLVTATVKIPIRDVAARRIIRHIVRERCTRG